VAEIGGTLVRNAEFLGYLPDAPSFDEEEFGASSFSAVEFLDPIKKQLATQTW
jgi:hypothetical protein